MVLGEKIKFLRKRKGFTQEALAEKMNVSRSAVAKWESDNGVPDLGNLKMITQIFAISIDELLDDTSMIEEDSLEETIHNYDFSEYKGYYYDIELNGWNDGVYDVFIVGEDKDFIFYQKNVKGRCVHGLIGKAYITSVNKTKKYERLSDDAEFVGRNYFCMKHVYVELAKEGLIKGFFDFSDDDYRDVVVVSFSQSKVSIKFGREIDVVTISKMEELNT